MIVLFLAAGLVVVAAGCGGGSKSPAVPATGATSTRQATTTGNSGTGFASASNCRQFAYLATMSATASSLASSRALQLEMRDLQALANAAPSDIKGDFQTFATALSSYLKAFEKSGWKAGVPETAAQFAALTRAAKVFNTEKLKAAEQHLLAWSKANCR
jgi:hypothetical protein